MKPYLPILLLSFLSLPTLADDAPKPHPRNIGGIESPDGATITGVVRFKGAKPPVKPVSDIAGNAFCKNCYKDGLPPQDKILLGKNGDDDTVQNVLVYISKGLEGKTFDPPKEPALLDQVGCMYTPHVVAVMVGQTLNVRNSDATLHNVMANPRQNPPFNFGMSEQNGIVPKVFKKPEFKLNVRCFMHPWMSGYIHVLPHPFFAVTGKDGTYTITGLPPGQYELTVLQETSLLTPTPATATVKVAAKETRKQDFLYQPKEKK
jgi:hypothetical protein